jgi:hypothetical protein
MASGTSGSQITGAIQAWVPATGPRRPREQAVAVRPDNGGGSEQRQYDRTTAEPVNNGADHLRGYPQHDQSSHSAAVHIGLPRPDQQLLDNAKANRRR